MITLPTAKPQFLSARISSFRFGMARLGRIARSASNSKRRLAYWAAARTMFSMPPLDFIVDGYLPVVETIEERVLEMEQSALDTFLSRAEVKRIFGLRQELIRFKRIIGPMTEACGRLVHIDTPCLDANARPYFQDVLDHLRRVDAMVNSLRDVLTSVFQVSNLLEQQRQDASVGRLGCNTGRIHHDCRHLRNELREHAGDKNSIWLLYRSWHYRLGLHSAVRALQTRSMA